MENKKGSRKAAGGSTGSVVRAAGAAPARDATAAVHAKAAKGGTVATAPAKAAQGGISVSPGAGELVVTMPVPAIWARFELREAQRAYTSYRGEFESLAPAELVIVRNDLQKMAVTTHTLVGRDSAPERRAVFERQAAQGNYDLSLFDRLTTLSLAAWYVRRQQQRALFTASGAAVSKEEVARAYELRGRMVGVLQHWHGDRHDIAVDLAQVREGSGHQDLANDLDTLAELYAREDVRTLIAHDIKHYRASDVDDALRLATIIAASLGIAEEGEAERLTDLARRAATLLVRGYEEHARCGRFFFGKIEDVTVTYPSLFAAVRSAPRKRPSDEAPVDEAPVDEAPVDEAPADAPGDETADGSGPA
jgi:hypothetical protein